ncbi:ATP-dependent DNA helicase Rep [Lujinxingia sediminis]|uniref:DNA 3'-5' helicase n=1 Tax=Lujinxingia sediminis TaxID=2480984 RepID=A0ABY0CZ42_9DELT|nr:UvrD-helicase domain-containing protein [Lujinxingia sediminis]RVU48846.1 ATP-dependent DNA helicase Rep [Lujinxingia sediminis]
MDLQLHLLNPQQRQAVEHIGGPLLILAGAGSGKTRVIIHRIGYLLQQGIAPGHILAVSFTNKAAQEMQERVAHLVGPGAREIYLSTFHSLGADILRQDIDVIGYKKPFTILDQGDQLAVVKDAMAELQLDPKMVDPRNVLALISRAKMAFSDPEEVEELRTNPLLPFAQRIFHRYQSALRGLNAVDFDDLICLPVRVFQASEETRLKWSQRFHFVMVDEYQDTNHTQLLFLDELVRDHQNIVVVGDDDQSIYGFRGAVAENILEFEYQFNKCRVIKLEQNYRSTNTILKAANELIANNSVRKEKALWSANGDGEPILYVECAHEREEAEFVAAEIERVKLNLGLEYDDFAILYRVNPQARLFEEALRGFRIPYTLVGGTEFFDRKEVKDFLGYLKAALNPNDEINVRRIVNVPPRGIGPTLLERISDLAHEREWGFARALEEVAGDPDLVHGIGPSSASHLSELVQMLKTYRARFREAEKEGTSLTEVGRAFLKRTKLIEHVRNIEKNPKIARRRVDNLEDLLGSIATFEEREGGTLEGYLNRISLDRTYDNGEEEKARGVKMMTLHSSKGLEFKVVFFVGLEEGYMPHERSKTSEDGIAEERRLAYVGLTRAKEVLYLTSAYERTRFGQKEEREPSRFLDEIPLKLLKTLSASGASSLSEKREDQNMRYLAALRSAIFDD